MDLHENIWNRAAKRIGDAIFRGSKNVQVKILIESFIGTDEYLDKLINKMNIKNGERG